MLKKIKGLYQSTVFNHPSIVHGFSTKQFGDMRVAEKRMRFLSALGMDASSLVWQEQVHGDSIHTVSPHNRGKSMTDADGLVYKKNPQDSPVVLSVHTADCVPLLLFDPVAHIIACAHAGWRGTVLHIGKKVIQKMKSLGSIASDIRVAVGPHVCGSCYTIVGDREEKFREAFPDHPDIFSARKGKTTVDIGLANVYDFQEMGIPEAHIDVDPSLCTFEKSDELYSYRRSGKPLPGETIGVIGFR